MADKTFKGKITAKGTEIAVLSQGTDDDYISLTDIAKYKNVEFPADVIKIGCGPDLRLITSARGNNFTTRISNWSNSTSLRVKRALMLLCFRRRNGLNLRTPSVLFQNRDAVAALTHTKILRLSSPRGFPSSLSCT